MSSKKRGGGGKYDPGKNDSPDPLSPYLVTTRCNEQMLVQCWAADPDDGPTLFQSLLLARMLVI